jgi:hypothetical protein
MMNGVGTEEEGGGGAPRGPTTRRKATTTAPTSRRAGQTVRVRATPTHVPPHPPEGDTTPDLLAPNNGPPTAPPWSPLRVKTTSHHDGQTAPRPTARVAPAPTQPGDAGAPTRVNSHEAQGAAPTGSSPCTAPRSAPRVGTLSPLSTPHAVDTNALSDRRASGESGSAPRAATTRTGEPHGTTRRHYRHGTT